MYIEMGKFGIPAKHHEAIALIYAKVRGIKYLKISRNCIKVKIVCFTIDNTKGNTLC